jgi:CBS domain-containing protein
MELRDLLSGEIFTIPHLASVAEAAECMEQEGVGSLAVLEDDALAGIITERDVVSCVAGGEEPSSAAVGDWMTSYPDSFLPDMEVKEAADWMLAAGYRHLPVVDNGTLLGMASIKDILWAVTGETAD